jgi:hypothetical protein
LLAEINELLTECYVNLCNDGSPTEQTQLQRWPRFAPPPKQLTITSRLDLQTPAAALVAFCSSCMQQQPMRQMLRGVETLNLEVSTAFTACRYLLGVATASLRAILTLLDLCKCCEACRR